MKLNLNFKNNKRVIIYASIGVLILAGLLYMIFNRGNVSYGGRILAGVNSEVVIERDSSGIPSVKVWSVEDAFYALGFLHAQDRLVLIEYFRAMATGTLSEMTGKEGIPVDKLSLTLGFIDKAERILQSLDNPYRMYLNAYTRGLNFSKQENGRNFSVLSGLSRPVWEDKDVVSILLLFEWSDAFLNNKELIFPFPENVDKAALKNIIPEELLYTYSEDERKSVEALRKIRKIINDKIGSFQEGIAFYINGNRTKDGRAVTGFSLDSRLSLYSKWYPVSLAIGEDKIDGITASGLPFIFFGNNGPLSFFRFNLKMDTQDIYLEKTRESRAGLQYYRNGSWKDFDIKEEVINAGSSVTEDNTRISVRSTDRGPVISDIFDESSGKVLSISGIFPNKEYIISLFKIPFCLDIENAKKAAVKTQSLPGVFLFATRDSALSVYSGKLPVRDISRILPDADAPAAKLLDISMTAESGSGDIIAGDMIFINEHPLTGKYIVSRDINRLECLQQQLNNSAPFSTESLTGLVRSSYSIIAEKFGSLFIPALEQIPITSAKLTKIYFNNWDFTMEPDSVPAAIFQVFLIYLIQETVADESGDKSLLMDDYGIIVDNFYNLFKEGVSPLFDDIKTKNIVEDKDIIFSRAFIKAMRYFNNKFGPTMEDWKWGKINHGHFNVPLWTSFLEKQFVQQPEMTLSGGISTIKKASISANEMIPDKISCLSGLFYIDLHLSFVSKAMSNSMDPGSEYYGVVQTGDNLKNMDIAKSIYTLRLVPYKSE